MALFCDEINVKYTHLFITTDIIATITTGSICNLHYSVKLLTTWIKTIFCVGHWSLFLIVQRCIIHKRYLPKNWIPIQEKSWIYWSIIWNMTLGNKLGANQQPTKSIRKVWESLGWPVWKPSPTWDIYEIKNVRIPEHDC